VATAWPNTKKILLLGIFPQKEIVNFVSWRAQSMASVRFVRQIKNSITLEINYESRSAPVIDHHPDEESRANPCRAF
jgi:hypothetical protein